MTICKSIDERFQTDLIREDLKIEILVFPPKCFADLSFSFSPGGVGVWNDGLPTSRRGRHDQSHVIDLVLADEVGFLTAEILRGE